MDYNNSELQDYLNNDDFIRWVLHSENDAYWQRIKSLHPNQQPLIDQARQLVIHLHEAENPATLSVDEERVWKKVRETIVPAQGRPAISRPAQPYRSRWQTPLFRWAAILVCLLGVGWFTVQYLTDKPLTYSALVTTVELDKKLIERVNTSDQPIPISLEDGSLVRLAKNSRLSFPAHFNAHRREVILDGEAFFEVAKNPAKPFFVYTDEVVTKVLGTSFRIKAFDDARQIEVDVHTGRVSVFTQRQLRQDDQESRGVVLMPNQQAIVNRTNDVITKRLVDNPVPVKSLPVSAKKQFDEVPASRVLQELEALYGVKILYNEELLSKCIITTSLGNESLKDKLDIICQTIGATYKEIDAQFVIESKGCAVVN